MASLTKLGMYVIAGALKADLKETEKYVSHHLHLSHLHHLLINRQIDYLLANNLQRPRRNKKQEQKLENRRFVFFIIIPFLHV